MILAQEPREFNQFLRHLHEKWKTTDLANFFNLILSKDIRLISNGEAADRYSQLELTSLPYLFASNTTCLFHILPLWCLAYLNSGVTDEEAKNFPIKTEL